MPSVFPLPSTSACISCHTCTQGCHFLGTYQMTLADFAQHPEYATECCLCNNCMRTCPVDISGADIAQAHRSIQKRYPRWITWAAKHYPLKSWRQHLSKRILFLGCNIPKYYPKTADALIDLLGKEGITHRIDCCRRPALETGTDANLIQLYRSFIEEGVEEIVVACPNCYYTLHEARKQLLESDACTTALKERLIASCDKATSIPTITSIYQVLHQIAWQVPQMPDKPLPIYIPCPDRDTHHLLHDIEQLIPVKPVCTEVQCCGLGGQVYRHHPNTILEAQQRLAHHFFREYPPSSNQPCYMYCASCAYACNSTQSIPAIFILSHLLGIDEPICVHPRRAALSFALKRS